MATLVVVGAQWGDEAKGKLVDVLSENANLVVRYNGGNNAGHTVQVGDKVYKFHLTPSGVIRNDVISVIADGVVVDPKALLSEIKAAEDLNITPKTLKVSANAHVILPYHIAIEKLEEQAKGDNKIGTTLRGIGPCYVDKTSRIGLRMGDCVDLNRFKSKLNVVASSKNTLLLALNGEPISVASVFADYAPVLEQLAPFVAETSSIIYDMAAGGKNVLFEGAQGSLLDIDYGTYPYVTSSHPVSGGATLGTGIGPKMINQILGIAKAYNTRVGGGPFPTELDNSIGEHIRKNGNEFGTTTGRPRRCGWLDLVALRYACRINSLTSIALTRLDVLDDFDSINICTAYDIDGEITNTFSNDIEALAKAKPIFKSFEGWRTPTTGAKQLDDLPPNAISYIKAIEEMIETPISVVSIGPERTQTIIARNDLLWG